MPWGRPSTSRGAGAPVTAIQAPRWNRRAAPPSVNSRAAAPCGLPTSRLARQRLGRSAAPACGTPRCAYPGRPDRKSTRLNSSPEWISYDVFCLKKKKMAALVSHALQNDYKVVLAGDQEQIA